MSPLLPAGEGYEKVIHLASLNDIILFYPLQHTNSAQIGL